MKLIAEIKQKNELLLLQRAELYRQLGARINAPAFRPFFVTFIAAPFLLGFLAKFSSAHQRQSLFQLALGVLRLKTMAIL